MSFWGNITKSVSLPSITPEKKKKAQDVISTANQQVRGFAKDVVQGTARSVATVGMTAGNAPTQIANKVSSFWGAPKQPLPFAPETPTTGNKVTEAVFGGKPVRTIQGATKKTAADITPTVGSKAAKIIAPVLAVSSIGLDLSGIGGEGEATKSIFSKVIDEFSKLKHGTQIANPEGVISIGKNVVISRRSVKHIIEQRGELAHELIHDIPNVLANPTKIVDNSLKRPNSFLYARMNGKARATVLEVTKTPDGKHQVVSAFPMYKHTYEKLVDNSGGPHVPSLDIAGAHPWNAISTAQRDKSIIKNVPGAGIEPATPAFSKLRSTPELSGRGTTLPQPFDPLKYVAEQAAKQKPKTGLVAKAKSFLAEAKKKLVDSNAPIEDVLAKNLKQNKMSLLPEGDITNYIDRVYRAPTLAGQFARDNGLENVIKQVDNVDNLDQYMIAKQATDVNTRGITTGRDLAKDQQLIKVFAPKYEAQAKAVNAYSQRLLDYAVESGMVKSETAAMLKKRYPNYVPLKRVMDDIEQGGNGSGTGVASLGRQTAVQSIKGSERQIESPLQSLLDKTNEVFAQGEKNKAAKVLASYEKLPGNPFQLKEIKAMVDEKTGRRIFMEGDAAKDTVSFFDNGEKRVFKTTPEIAAAAKALDVQQLNILGKILAFPVRVAKVGITGINLPFVGANIAKDQLSAFINSKNALKTSILNPINFVRALFSAVKHDELYKEMVRAGGGGTSFDIARNQAKNTIERIRSSRSVGSKIKYTVTHPGELLRTLENIIGRSEEFTRLQQYRGTKQALLKKGNDATNATMGAARAARENTVNFARRGEWGKVLNSAFLYLNAGIQGSRTFLRTLKTNPLGATAKIATAVFLPVATITAWNLKDPERKQAYEDIAEYEKEGNIIIIPEHPTKDANGKWNVIKIPLSQEINNIANIPRKAIEATFHVNPLKAQDFVSAVIGSISPVNPTKGSVVSTLTPQAIRPTLEGLTNKNFFTGYPQVPQSLEKLPAKLQVKANTSGTAQKIANVLNLSPIKVEEFLKGTFGSITPQVLHTSDKVFTPNQVGGVSTQKAVAARFTKAQGGEIENKQQQAYYDLESANTAQNAVENKKLQPTYDHVQQLVSDGKEGEARALVEGLSDSDYAIYKRIKASDKRKSTVQSEQQMLPKVKEILTMIANGKEDEAQATIEALSDEEYRIYQLTKKKLQ